MTYGLLVLAINIGYLVFSIIVGIVLAKLLKKSAWFQKRSTALLSIVLFLLIFLAPFYDLLIQKGIKTYYEVFDKTYAKIYAYPEKDAEGRVESLAENRNFDELPAYFIDTQKERAELKNRYFWIKSFSENYVRGSFEENMTKDFGYARFNFNKTPITYEKIESPKDFKARYQVFAKINQYWFYKEIKTTFWDKKTNKLLAETLEIAFPIKNKKNKFRYKYLHQHGANGGGGIGVKGIYGLRNSMYFKLFVNKNAKKETET